MAAKTEVVTPAELWKLFDKKMSPVYPYEARRAQGTGLYRMYIDADGSVRAVGVMKSTGNKVLDLAVAGGARTLSREAAWACVRSRHAGDVCPLASLGLSFAVYPLVPRSVETGESNPARRAGT